MVYNMTLYRAERDASHHSVLSKYNILGFISSRTYGRVYKAQSDGIIHAIKKFKPDKGYVSNVTAYTGISHGEIAVRMLAITLDLKLIYYSWIKKIDLENIVALKEVHCAPPDESQSFLYARNILILE